MNALKWVKIWFLLALAIPFVGLFNYIVDPYGFNKLIVIDKFNSIKESNAGFTIKYKMPQLANNEWSNIMLGSSKIGVMDNHVVDRYLGGKTFNMDQPTPVMPIQFDAFMYAVHYNNVKNLVFAIDFLSFNKNLKLNKDYVELKEKVRAFERFSNIDLYLNTDTLKKSIEVIRKNFSGTAGKKLHFYPNGMREYADYIEAYKNGTFNLQKNIKKHLKLYFDPKKGIYSNYEYSDDFMKLVKKIVEYCKTNDINLYVYISPFYVEHFYAIKEAGLLDEFEHFKRELVKITDYLDFTGANSITTDKNNYWDSSHLRIGKTKIVMAKLFRDPSFKGYEDFGVFVTPENIETHLKEQRRQYKKIDLDKILN
ncbi:MAG: hypothetical protein B5M52_03695 [Helicobacteraceae bacterium 4484_230]|nr:MAG: hypothetical protein B5M52_03695 [Helicobacteraceae bacterium 4484_230]